MKTKYNEAFHVMALSVKRCGTHYLSHDEMATVYGAAAEVSERFVRSAGLLPEKEFLGWQINAGKNEAHRAFVFSGLDAQVTREDLDWVFQKCASLEAASQAPFEEFWGKGRRMYALQYMPEDPKAGQDSPHGSGGNPCVDGEMESEFFASLGKFGAALQITASGTGGGTGTILLSLPHEMTLRMRAMLSLAFPGTVAVECNGLDDAGDEIGRFPAEYLAAVMTGLLAGLMLERPKQERAAEHKEDTPPSPAREADEVPRVIEDMGLSVRAFTCLKRAGINTVEELRELSHEDLLHIPNLGRKSMEEISQSLARWGYLLTPANYSTMLEELVGLDAVKEQVRKITALAKMKRDMAALGKNPAPVVLNMEFVGNPGTAKTTVARILAGIFHEVGLLPSNHLVEVGRADLVAQHVGHTADKVRSAFRRAKGKLLFIDEAYSLIDDRTGSFGDEAINTIVQEMENNRKDTIVIFAGYPDKMEALFSRNPGLRSRVPFRISFSDYSADEMTQIAVLEAERRGFSIQRSARERVASICAAAAGHPELGNGRFCRNLVESAILGYASRVYGDNDGSADKNFELVGGDFALPEILRETKKTARIGFRP